MLKRICTQLENKENVKILKRKLFQKKCLQALL